MIKSLSGFLKRTKATAERADVPFHKDTFLTLSSAELSHDPINVLKIKEIENVHVADTKLCPTINLSN